MTDWREDDRSATSRDLANLGESVDNSASKIRREIAEVHDAIHQSGNALYLALLTCQFWLAGAAFLQVAVVAIGLLILWRVW